MQVFPTSGAFVTVDGGDIIGISSRSLSQESYSPQAIMWHCLLYDMLSHFDRTPICDGYTNMEA